MQEIAITRSSIGSSSPIPDSDNTARGLRRDCLILPCSPIVVRHINALIGTHNPLYGGQEGHGVDLASVREIGARRKRCPTIRGVAARAIWIIGRICHHACRLTQPRHVGTGNPYVRPSTARIGRMV